MVYFLIQARATGRGQQRKTVMLHKYSSDAFRSVVVDTTPKTRLAGSCSLNTQKSDTLSIWQQWEKEHMNAHICKNGMRGYDREVPKLTTS